MGTSRRTALWVLALASVPSLARADGLDVERFVPAVGPEGNFAAEHPEVPVPWGWDLGLFLNYARDPLVVRTGDDVTQRVVQNALTADLIGSIGFFGRAELGIDLPVHIVYSGDGYTNGAAMLAPNAGLGDLRLVPKGLLVRAGNPHEHFLLGVAMPITLPTGDADRARGDGGVTLTPELLLAFHAGRFGVGADVGYRWRQDHPAGLPFGNEITLDPWISFRLTRDLTLRGELLAEDEIETAVGGTNVPAELIAGIDYAIGPIDLDLGATRGLTNGVGDPEFRVFAGIRYRRHLAHNEGFGDSDHDGVPDQYDHCPNQAEDEDGFQDSDGCPDPDNDGDGIPDNEDECPDLPGDRAHDGCPAKTYVKIIEGRIYIFGKVLFPTGSAHIDARSNQLLDQIAEALRDSPQVRHVRIDGYTDNVGPPAMNQRLSEERAAAVKAALEHRGIASGRLSARGYGETHPVASNRAPAGRAKNRRVDFIIVGGQ